MLASDPKRTLPASKNWGPWMEVDQEVLQRIIPLVKAVVLDEADTVPLDLREDDRPVSHYTSPRPVAGAMPHALQ